MTGHRLDGPGDSPGGRPLRILTLVDGIGTYGGAESLARRLVQRLDPERFERSFCVSRWDPGDAANPLVAGALEELEQAGVEFIGLERHGRPALRPWGKLLARLRREPVDILHTHKFGSNAWGALLAPLGRVPVFIAHEHSWAFEGKPWRRLLDRHLVARSATVMVAVSAEDRRRMIEIEHIPQQLIELIPNGIADPPADSGADVRAELGIDPGAPVIGTVATLRTYKGVDVLVDAAAVLARDHPELRVLVAGGDEGGDTSVREALRRQIAEHGLERNVLLLGFRSDVPTVVRAMDVAVCPSDFEGSPLSVMEYMEEAKPVVASAVGGLPDIVEEGVTGSLVPPRDPQRLAAAIAGLLADPAARERMGARARELRRARYSIDATLRRLTELYERTAGEAGIDA